MTDIKDAFFATSQEEIEEAHFGGGIYHDAYKLPQIIINSKNIETFKNYTTLVRDISQACGEEITILFANLYMTYDMKEEQNNVIHDPIKYFCTIAIGQLALSLKQSEKLILLINEFDNKKEDININGKEYCFILIMLNKLFYIYTKIYSLLSKKRYFGSENVECMLQRLSFILSDEFESIRKLFKTVEGFNEIDSAPTFH